MSVVVCGSAKYGEAVWQRDVVAPALGNMNLKIRRILGESRRDDYELAAATRVCERVGRVRLVHNTRRSHTHI